MKMQEKDIEKMRQVQLKILNAFVDVCEKNNLNYFLIAGTLLGAVRHKGFIPWDDDIDVGMPRADYDKFAEIANQELPSTMFYQSIETEPEYRYFFSKIRYNNSKFTENHSKHLNINHGVYIDVFPIDGCSNSYKLATKHMKRFLFLRRLYSIDILSRSEKNVGIKAKLGARVLKIYAGMLGDKRILKRADKLIKRYSTEESELWAALPGTYRNKEIHKREIIFDRTIPKMTAEFCGQKYVSVSKPKEYLKGMYNNYMELPPVEKRISHHEIIEFKVFD